ncbi:hypothetical protein BpHYR1_027863 [Brachionus plicatilis]|uniref:Uncharacterized protein n=1 Tax=Brachionus plicatilis TaxID=10195 RepID=A0A3M7SAK2_BRAPC|nr:hypothetical protein BpHYR1_027863 [Brachionus plicatilis]
MRMVRVGDGHGHCVFWRAERPVVVERAQKSHVTVLFETKPVGHVDKKGRRINLKDKVARVRVVVAGRHHKEGRGRHGRLVDSADVRLIEYAAYAERRIAYRIIKIGLGVLVGHFQSADHVTQRHTLGHFELVGRLREHGLVVVYVNDLDVHVNAVRIWLRTIVAVCAVARHHLQRNVSFVLNGVNELYFAAGRIDGENFEFARRRLHLIGAYFGHQIDDHGLGDTVVERILDAQTARLSHAQRFVVRHKVKLEPFRIRLGTE